VWPGGVGCYGRPVQAGTLGYRLPGIANEVYGRDPESPARSRWGKRPRPRAGGKQAILMSKTLDATQTDRAGETDGLAR
jgi:hypothetical protein